MTTTQLKALFPLQGEVTEEILKNAKKFKPSKCIGALTLKTALKKEGALDNITDSALWGRTHGNLFSSEDEAIIISTEDRIDIMEITEPRTITFITH